LIASDLLDSTSMSAEIRVDANRQPIAIVEIEDSYESLYELRRIVPSHAVLQEHRNHAPARGLLWVDILISGAARGPQWAAAATDAVALLETFSRELPTYRLVDGHQWLGRAVAPCAAVHLAARRTEVATCLFDATPNGYR
jgi:hypothetical protein